MESHDSPQKFQKHQRIFLNVWQNINELFKTKTDPRKCSLENISSLGDRVMSDGTNVQNNRDG